MRKTESIRWGGRGVVLVLMVACAVWVGTARGAEELFERHRLWEAHIRVTAEGWKRMQMQRPIPVVHQMGVVERKGLAERLRDLLLPASRPATRPATRAVEPVGKGDYEVLPAGYYGRQYTYVRGVLEFDGEVFKDVGIRFKGAASYDTMADSLKRPFKIDFNRFVEGQDFYGLQQINLQNNACDPSQIRDAISYWAFREAGIVAPRTTFVLLYLTIEGQQERTCLGMYTLVEEVDKRFLKSRFNSKAGLLVKPEMGNLPYLGENWSAYKKGYQPKTDGTEEEIRRLIEIARVVNKESGEAFREKLEKLMDVDQFLRFLAVNVMISNLDGLLGICHNYYLYAPPGGGKVVWIPWDLNLAWGNYQRMGGWDELMELSLAKPWSNQKPLLEKVMGISEWREVYMGHLRRLTGGPLSIERVKAEIGAMEGVIREADRRAGGAIVGGNGPGVPWPPSWRKPPSPGKFAEGRWVSLRSQLEGRPAGEGYSGYVPRYRMGGLHEGRWYRAAAPLADTAAAFAAMDADRNGKLSEGELEAGIVGVLFGRADREGRGTIDKAEVGAVVEELKRKGSSEAGAKERRPVNRGDQPKTPAETILFEADRDLDGKLGKGEVRAAIRRFIFEYDLDDDGELDAQQLANAAGRFLAGW